MFILADDNLIFVADEFIFDFLKGDSEGKRSIIRYQLEREDGHKIYLPPCVMKIILESQGQGEIRAQIENTFDSFGSTETKKIFQEACLTAEWLRDTTQNMQIVFLTDKEKFHRPNFVLCAKDHGFSAVWTYNKLDLLYN